MGKIVRKNIVPGNMFQMNPKPFGMPGKDFKSKRHLTSVWLQESSSKAVRRMDQSEVRWSKEGLAGHNGIQGTGEHRCDGENGGQGKMPGCYGGKI